MTNLPDLERRLDANFDAIIGELTAPPRGHLERALIAMRVPEPTARMVAATPVLRWAWIAAVGAVLLLAASAGDAGWDQRDRLAFLLALAPVVPVLSVAVAYGAHADRAYEVSIAAPLSGFRLLVLRTITVVAAAAALTTLTALVSAAPGLLRLAWLAPSLATTSLTLALGATWGLRRAAVGVALTWLVVVVAVSQATDDAVAPFVWPAQVMWLVVGVGATAVVLRSRSRWDRWIDT